MKVIVRAGGGIAPAAMRVLDRERPPRAACRSRSRCRWRRAPARARRGRRARRRRRCPGISTISVRFGPAMERRVDLDVHARRTFRQLRRAAGAPTRGVALKPNESQRLVVRDAAPLQHVGRLDRAACRVRASVEIDAGGAARRAPRVPQPANRRVAEHDRALDVLAVVSRAALPGADVDQSEDSRRRPACETN